jgi:hypothetical protein
MSVQQKEPTFAHFFWQIWQLGSEVTRFWFRECDIMISLGRREAEDLRF